MPDSESSETTSWRGWVVRYFLAMQQRRRDRRALAAVRRRQMCPNSATLQESTDSSTELEAKRLRLQKADLASQSEETINMPQGSPFAYDAKRLDEAEDIIAELDPDAPHVRSFERLRSMSPKEIQELSEEASEDVKAKLEDSALRFMLERRKRP